MKNVIVTGGCGYIGSHTSMKLAEAGFQPITIDNLTNGDYHAAQWGPVFTGDVRDKEYIRFIFEKHKPVGVLHFAAMIEVGISTQEPAQFYDNNVYGTICMSDLANQFGIPFVFSSTCATYGVPKFTPMSEDHPQAPLNPYGHSKLMAERVLTDLHTYKGLKSVTLRYFNAAGADPEGRIGESHDPETHVIPLAIAAAKAGQSFNIFGTDYPTLDGTAVRDYVHVVDLADAHVKALNYLLAGGDTTSFNLGTGRGTSVRELLDTISRVVGKIDVKEHPRRDGDSPELVSDSSRAKNILNWSPTFSLDDIIETAARWHGR